jgi:hypothetical protein
MTINRKILLATQHWTLNLNPRWKLVAGNRKGDFRVVESKSEEQSPRKEDLR